MAKTGRNQPCPCGSGRKFKKCHGASTANSTFQFDGDAFQRRRVETEANEAQRQKQQGYGKPIISTQLNGIRVLAIGNRIYQSSGWKTFHDFLQQYLIAILGLPWLGSEQEKPESEQHQILKWINRARLDMEAIATRKGEILSAPMTGAQRAFLNLAYNIYLIDHHSEPAKSQAIVNSFVEKLKSSNRSDFIGKLFETYASAAFLKAGFQIDYENESDGSRSHVEFIATFPETQKKFSVEVKARNRLVENDGPTDEVQRLRVSSKLVSALKKNADHTRIVMIEVNVPDVVGSDYQGTWVEAALSQIDKAESFLDNAGDIYPPAYVIVTNHAYHNNLESLDCGIQAIADGYLMPDFGPGAIVIDFKEYLENLERHKEILALFDSLKLHSRIPVTFDGENPEFAFSEDQMYPRLKIGQEYMVPNGSGGSETGILENAIVMETWKKAQGVYRLRSGQRLMVSHELTERELRAWRLHPETFFGQIEERNEQPQNWCELAHFFYRSYKKTPKETLLTFMKEAEDYDSLKELRQEELAIVYCERMAWSEWNSSHKSK
jgi:hypothetical protein